VKVADLAPVGKIDKTKQIATRESDRGVPWVSTCPSWLILDTEPNWFSGFRNAWVAVNTLRQMTRIDTQNIVLAGLSSGAYSLTALMNTRFRNQQIKNFPEYRKPLHQAFFAFVAIIGSQACPPKELGRRPMLFVGGDQDLKRLDGGLTRIELQKKVFDVLKNGGCDVRFIMQPGVGHEWSSSTYPDVRQWLYQKVPVFQKIHLLHKRLEKASNERAKHRIHQRIASSWLDIEAVRQSRQAIQSPQTRR